ncbi:MAG TPA: hypothetical protein VMB05_00775, partial [Solirubrobacteraceae bacterium]|nr:hypothetical protein [Solirubrobacteraceae bacterium]
MLSSRHIRCTLPIMLGCVLFVLALAGTGTAIAGPTVTVRVEGVSQTLLAPTEVTTDSTSVVKDGDQEHSCSGTSAAGALERATGGAWNGEWSESFKYSVETILGETHAFEPGAPANYFWAYWLNNKSSSVGICEGELSAGDSILFFPECFGAACPPVAPNPLGMSAPSVAERAAPVTVMVTSYANVSGEASPAVGATVTGGGASAVTDANGRATLSIQQTGNIQLQANAPDSVRTEVFVCVHDGNDGTCGTTKASSGSASVPTPVAIAPYKGPYAIVAQTTGLTDSHIYPRDHAPQVLKGTVATHARIASVSLRLRRSYRGHCFAYNGVTERFQRAR